MARIGDLTGAVVGERYTIEREIGHGGMATVWLATDARHGREVAIKTLHPDLAGAIGTDRFLREVRLTARLQHPNIVPILDSGVLDARGEVSVPWYAMPRLQGETLRDRLNRDGQLPVQEALRIIDAVGVALEAAHRQQIVHRDIKPENVFLAGDQVYVVDFGIARALGTPENNRITSTGVAIGTPAYMSPEQSVGETVDARTDQYSLAAMLYEMLVGEPPFRGPNSRAIFARRLAEPPPRIVTVRPGVPEAVERATLRALERTPADRFESVAAFLSALQGGDSSPRYAARERSGRLRRAGFAGALITSAGLLAWAVLTRDRVEARTVDAEVVALYHRGMQAHNSRTPVGSVEAIAALRAALARDSAYAPAWNGLAKAYARAHGRAFRVPDVAADRLLPLAVQAVDRSLALDSTDADAWMTHAILTHQIDPVDIAPALRSIRRSIALDSAQAPPWNYLALYLAESGDFDAALEAWRRCVRLGPAYAEGLSFLSLAHYWRGAFDSAAVWADSALRIDPNYLLARSSRGFIAVERHDFARAEAAFEAARRLSTDIEIVNALAGLALVKARSGRRMEANVLIQRAESLASAYDPVPLHTAVNIAKGYAALGDTDRSVGILIRFQPVQHAHFQLHLRCEPPFAPIANDRRFQALLIGTRPAAGKGC